MLHVATRIFWDFLHADNSKGTKRDHFTENDKIAVFFRYDIRCHLILFAAIFGTSSFIPSLSGERSGLAGRGGAMN